MRNRLKIGLFAMAVLLLAGCRTKDPTTERTLLLYYPWADNLQSYFSQNISDMAKAVTAAGGLVDQQVIIFYATSTTSGDLYRMQYKDGATSLIRLEQKTDMSFSSASDLAAVLSRVKHYAPARTYSMVIGAHGMGWVDKDDAASAPTRFWGGMTAATRIDLPDMVAAFRQADMHLEFLLLDCCYMAGVEVMYELRDLADYIIATTSELMGPGMPYAIMGADLLGEPDYRCLTRDFYDFYISYRTPCGTLAVIRTEPLDAFADWARGVHASHSFPQDSLSALQYLDGLTPHLFFDMADYYRHLGLTDEEEAEFDRLLEAIVYCEVHTPTFYSGYTSRQTAIHTCCGLTISAPSQHSWMAGYPATAWYGATAP